MDLIPCQLCGTPMVAVRNSHPRMYCSLSCAAKVNRRKILAREADVDPVVVDRLTHGHPTTSTRAERLQAAAVLLGRGRSYSQVATALRVTPHTVWRYQVQIRNRKEAA